MSIAETPKRPQGRPPSGQELLIDSTSAHTAPAQTGAAGSTATTRIPRAATAIAIVCVAASSAQGSQPIDPASHHNVFAMKTSPNKVPCSSADLFDTSLTASQSIAIAAGASQPTPYGSKEAAARSPPTTASMAAGAGSTRDIGNVRTCQEAELTYDQT